ncbi:MAG TPA: hypothetical protein VIY48_12705 [Candidatus Paceibacterota bacterium]
MTNKVFDIVTLFFIGALFVLIVTHAKGFATAAGTVFTGVNNLGTTLTGQRITAGEK